MPRVGKWKLIAIYAGFALIAAPALLLMFSGLRKAWYAAASSHWPKAPAVVAEAGVQHSTSTDSKTRAKSTMHSAVIRFDYRVEGKTYSTRTIQFGELEGSEDETDAEIRMLQYPVGASVSVSYNPDDPSLACVRPGFHAAALMVPFCGLAIVLVACMFLLVYLGSQGKPSVFGAGVGLFAVVFCLIGIAMLVPGVMNLWRGHTSQTWPESQGIIVYGRESTSEAGIVDAKGSTKYKPTWSARLIYEYIADGQKRFGNQRVFGQLAGSDAEWAADIMDRYPLAKRVPVRYSPREPDLSVLEPGIASETLWIPGIGLAFFLFGLAVMFVIVPRVSKPFP